jgi:hypothetical protein
VASTEEDAGPDAGASWAKPTEVTKRARTSTGSERRREFNIACITWFGAVRSP